MRYDLCFRYSIFTPANIFLELFYHCLSSFSSHLSLHLSIWPKCPSLSTFTQTQLTPVLPFFPPPPFLATQNTVLKSLISATNSTTESSSPTYKFAVTSTIIQHIPSAGADETEASRRGMHSATGAFWNNEKDGMWSYKYEKGQAGGNGFDVIVSVVWVSLL